MDFVNIVKRLAGRRGKKKGGEEGKSCLYVVGKYVVVG